VFVVRGDRLFGAKHLFLLSDPEVKLRGCEFRFITLPARPVHDDDELLRAASRARLDLRATTSRHQVELESGEPLRAGERARLEAAVALFAENAEHVTRHHSHRPVAPVSARKRPAIERLREIKAANSGQLPRPALQSLQPMSDERKTLPLRLADPDDAGSLRHARALCEHALDTGQDRRPARGDRGQPGLGRASPQAPRLPGRRDRGPGPLSTETAMRRKEDSDSWKAGGILRRDFRSGGQEPERTRRTPARKDVFRHCRGVEGRPHDLPELTLPDRGTDRLQRVPVRCARCGLWVALKRKGELYEERERVIQFEFGGEQHRHEYTERLYLYEGDPVTRRCDQNADWNEKTQREALRGSLWLWELRECFPDI